MGSPLDTQNNYNNKCECSKGKMHMLFEFWFVNEVTENNFKGRTKHI